MKYNWKLKLKYIEEYKAGKYIELPHNFRGDRHNFIHNKILCACIMLFI